MTLRVRHLHLPARAPTSDSWVRVANTVVFVSLPSHWIDAGPLPGPSRRWTDNLRIRSLTIQPRNYEAAGDSTVLHRWSPFSPQSGTGICRGNISGNLLTIGERSTPAMPTLQPALLLPSELVCSTQPSSASFQLDVLFADADLCLSFMAPRSCFRACWNAVCLPLLHRLEIRRTSLSGDAMVMGLNPWPIDPLPWLWQSPINHQPTA